MAIIIRPQAQIDIDGIADYLGSIHPPYALRFYDAVKDKLEYLNRFPNSGQTVRLRNPRHKEIRLAQIRRYPNHLIVFLPMREGVDVLRVVYGRMNLQAVLDLV